MLGGVYFFYVSCFKLLINLCLYVFIVCCLKSRFYFICLYFFHTCGYVFCLSVSGNIQVDSIKLLSTLATDG